MNQDYKKRLIHHYRQALKINPNHYVLYEKIAQFYYEIGELTLALQVCKTALQQNSEWELMVLPVLLEKMGLDYQDKQILTYLGVNTIKKTPIFDSNKTHKTSPFQYKATKINKIFNQGEELQAIHICFTLIENYPTLTWPHLLLNSQLILNPNLIPYVDEIITFYEQILQNPSMSPDAYTVLGNAFTKQGKIPEAIAAFKTGMSQRVYFNKYHPEYYHDTPKKSKVDFLIIGIGKGGTSALYRYLSEHPKILCTPQKELHFFNQNFELGRDWYLAQFPQMPLGSHYLTGEATPWYLVSHGVADKVYQTFPNIKLILLLRNPINRAISHYYMYYKLGKEKRPLEEAFTSELNILSEITNFDEISSQYWQTERGYLLLGLYAHFIPKWRALFAPEQFLILRSEYLYHHTEITLKKVYQFLEIPDHSLKDYPKYNAGSYPQISDKLYQRLADFFRSYNQQLEDYLKLRFNWE